MSIKWLKLRLIMSVHAVQRQTAVTESGVRHQTGQRQTAQERGPIIQGPHIRIPTGKDHSALRLIGLPAAVRHAYVARECGPITAAVMSVRQSVASVLAAQLLIALIVLPVIVIPRAAAARHGMDLWQAISIVIAHKTRCSRPSP
jgi:hypothetical protein